MRTGLTEFYKLNIYTVLEKWKISVKLGPFCINKKKLHFSYFIVQVYKDNSIIYV